MNKGYNTDNDILRAALYLEYEGKCFYEGLPLRFKDMHIDHIIPKTISDSDLMMILSELGLPSDFNINSLYNLVPCFPSVNQVKNKNQYPNKFLGHCIYDGTSKKVDSIKNRIELLSKEYKSDKDLAKLIARLSTEDKKELENLYNALSKEKPFEIQRNISKNEISYTFERSLPNVRIAAILPRYPKVNGSCLITFSNLRLRDCMITLNHNQIMEQLFNGAKTRLENKLRNFIIFSEEIAPNTYFVDLANVRLPLEKNEVLQLLDIIDDLYNLYIEESTIIYNTLSKDVFTSNSYKNRLRLFKIRKQLWFMIRDFCRTFDYANGDSNWHIFDASGSMIKVYDKKSGDFRLFIIPEVEQEEFIITKNDDVWLQWTDEFSWDLKLKDILSNKYWGPFFSYQWLINELIPQVVFHYQNKKSKPFRKKSTIDEFKQTFDISLYARALPQTVNYESLLEYVSQLQEFFNSRPHDSFQLNDMDELYTCLSRIIAKSKISSDEIHYVSGKLGIRDVSGKESLLKGINDLKLKNQSEEKVISSFSLDLIFRCMVVVLRDCKTSLTDFENVELMSKMQKYKELMVQERVRDESQT